MYEPKQLALVIAQSTCTCMSNGINKHVPKIEILMYRPGFQIQIRMFLPDPDPQNKMRIWIRAKKEMKGMNKS